MHSVKKHLIIRVHCHTLHIYLPWTVTVYRFDNIIYLWYLIIINLIMVLWKHRTAFCSNSVSRYACSAGAKIISIDSCCRCTIDIAARAALPASTLAREWWGRMPTWIVASTSTLPCVRNRDGAVLYIRCLVANRKYTWSSAWPPVRRLVANRNSNSNARSAFFAR